MLLVRPRLKMIWTGAVGRLPAVAGAAFGFPEVALFTAPGEVAATAPWVRSVAPFRPEASADEP